MNIKIITIILVVVLIYFQTKEDTSDLGTLKSTLETYKELSLDGDFEGLIEYVYPKTYISRMSKEELVSKVSNNKSGLRIADLVLQPRLPIKSYAKGVYTIVTYTRETIVDFPPLDVLNQDEKSIRQARVGRNMMLALARSDMKSGDTLDVNKETNTIHRKIFGTFILIKENKNGWKVIDLKSVPKKLLKKILHADIINEEQELITQTKDSMILELFRKK